jgi:hypothetical protein
MTEPHQPTSKIGRIPSAPPPGLPLHTPVRRPRSLRSRARRWFQRTWPALWTWLTGNTDARRGKPWLNSLLIILLLVALGSAVWVVLFDRSPQSLETP